MKKNIDLFNENNGEGLFKHLDEGKHLHHKKDLIISATTRYTKDQLYNYVESINRCGFTGDKIMVSL